MPQRHIKRRRAPATIVGRRSRRVLTALSRSRPPKCSRIIRRTSSEPILWTVRLVPDGTCTDRRIEEAILLPRPHTCTDVFESFLHSSPSRSPRQSTEGEEVKVVVSVTVEGSPGPVRAMVRLGASVQEAIGVVLDRYGREGRSPKLDTGAVASFQLHHSHFCLHSLDKNNKIGEVGGRSFYLRKSSDTGSESEGSNTTGLRGSDIELLKSQIAPVDPAHLILSFLAKRLDKLGRRTRRLWKIAVLRDCIIKLGGPQHKYLFSHGSFEKKTSPFRKQGCIALQLADEVIRSGILSDVTQAMASVLMGSCSFCVSSPAISSHHRDPSEPSMGRREVLLRTSAIATLAAIFHFSGTKPSYLGVQKNPPSLALCPATNNCISTSEDMADVNHYAPPWNYNPQEGLRKKPLSKEEALRELLQVVESTKPDNYKPRIVEKKDDYIRVEYESPIMGFVDDVEFWFPPGNKSVIQYRSASRLGNFDFFDINRKRIKALRSALEKKGWASDTNF